jgi:hypothetical protein
VIRSFSISSIELRHASIFFVPEKPKGSGNLFSLHFFIFLCFYFLISCAFCVFR